MLICNIILEYNTNSNENLIFVPNLSLNLENTLDIKTYRINKKSGHTFS